MRRPSTRATVSLVAVIVLAHMSCARDDRPDSAEALRQIMLACHRYNEAHGALPAAYSADKQGKPLLSWRVHILPYLGERELYEQFHLDEAWDSSHNQSLVERMPSIYTHPVLELEPGQTAYLAVVGNGASFVAPRNPSEASRVFSPIGIPISEISDNDGTSRTIGILEVNAEQSVIWTAPRDFDITDISSLKERLVGPLPDGSWHAAFIDGASGKPIRNTATEKVLKNWFQYNDGN